MKNIRREEKAIKDLLYEQLIKREQWLRDLKQNLETSIQNAPSGNLKIINCRGVEQYYLDSVETRTSYPNGKICENLISNWQVNLHNEIMMRNCCQR